MGLSMPMPAMDRNLTGLCADQGGFFKFVIFPLFDLWVEHFPECCSIREMAAQNLKAW